MPQEAITAYETVVKSYLRHGSMKYQVKDLLLKCMMCRFLMVKVNNKEEQLNRCKDALRRYEDMDIHLGGTREAELMAAVIDGAIEEGIIGTAREACLINYNFSFFFPPFFHGESVPPAVCTFFNLSFGQSIRNVGSFHIVVVFLAKELHTKGPFLLTPIPLLSIH